MGIWKNFIDAELTEKQKSYTIKVYFLVILIVFAVSIPLMILTQNATCEDCYNLTGYLSNIKKSGHIVVDGQDYFISDWFVPNGNMPSYVNNYIGYNVSIDYVAGCGRRMITNIEFV